MDRIGESQSPAMGSLFTPRSTPNILTLLSPNPTTFNLLNDAELLLGLSPSTQTTTTTSSSIPSSSTPSSSIPSTQFQPSLLITGAPTQSQSSTQFPPSTQSQSSTQFQPSSFLGTWAVDTISRWWCSSSKFCGTWELMDLRYHCR